MLERLKRHKNGIDVETQGVRFALEADSPKQNPLNSPWLIHKYDKIQGCRCKNDFRLS